MSLQILEYSEFINILNFTTYNNVLDILCSESVILIKFCSKTTPS